MATSSQHSDANGKLGTFAGVFTPSVLTILGIILFLRLGFVVGNAGLGRALVIIGLANAISVLTSFSLAAIATNLKVKGGGDYYLISRTLGVEFGGAIGLVLFLAQSVSVGFYCLGFGEALAGILGPGTWSPQLIAAVAAAFLMLLSWLGADVATRFQYLVMACLAAALISFFAGGLPRVDPGMWTRNWAPLAQAPSFWLLFAIFFPAVTGFTQGVSMSGDLADPGRSLPLGTFLAVGISLLVYFGVALVFAGALPGSILATDYLAMKRLSLVPWLIDAGVIAATLSSGMASFLGAPRILQSLAGDHILPVLNPFAKGHGPAGNPRRGVLLTGVIAYATIGLGQLNLIAPVVSMFFLVSYGLLNIATYYEARSNSPSFRPRFRWYHRGLSLAGGLGCLGAMLAIDPAAGAVAVAVLLAMYQYLKRTAGPARWADSSRSFHLQLVREHLLAAASESGHPRDWRPHLLVLAQEEELRPRLVEFASWLEGGSGLTSVLKLVEAEGPGLNRARRRAEEDLVRELSAAGRQALPLGVAAPEPDDALPVVLQAHGLGPVRPNLLLTDWPRQVERRGLGLKGLRQARLLRTAFRLQVNALALSAPDGAWQALEAISPHDRRLDVWWWGDATSRLMLLLAYLMTRHPRWEEAGIRVLARAGGDHLKRRDQLAAFLEEVRIPAQAVVLEQWDQPAVVEQSCDAAVVFFPLRFGGGRLLDPFGGPLEDMAAGLGICALTRAAEDVDLDAEPEEGRVAEVAQALDQLARAEKRARLARERAEAARRQAEKKLEAASDPGAFSGGEWMELMRQALQARQEEGRAARRVAKALARMQDARRLLEELGVTPPGEAPEETNARQAQEAAEDGGKPDLTDPDNG